MEGGVLVLFYPLSLSLFLSSPFYWFAFDQSRRPWSPTIQCFTPSALTADLRPLSVVTSLLFFSTSFNPLWEQTHLVGSPVSSNSSFSSSNRWEKQPVFLFSFSSRWGAYLRGFTCLQDNETAWIHPWGSNNNIRWTNSEVIQVQVWGSGGLTAHSWHFVVILTLEE